MTWQMFLLEDLSRALPGEYKTITALAPAERREVWKTLISCLFLRTMKHLMHIIVLA